MTKKIEDLELLKIDRVRKGSNPGSRIVLMKSAVPVAKTTLEELRSAANAAVRKLDPEMWIETVDVETLVAIASGYDGQRYGVQLVKNGDLYETTGDPYPVMLEYRPVTKSAKPGSEKGAATVPINRDELDEEVLALLVEVETERDAAVAKAEAAAAENETLRADKEPAVETDVLKSLPDDARELVLKAQADAADAQERIAKMELERETSRFVNIAKAEFGKTGEDAIETGAALQAVAESHGEDSAVYKTVYKTVKGASAMIDAAIGQLGRPVGSGAAGGKTDGAVATIQTLTKEYIAEHKVPFATAWDAVRKANPELVASTQDDRAVRAGR